MSTSPEFKAAGMWVCRSRKSSQRNTVLTNITGEARAYPELQTLVFLSRFSSFSSLLILCSVCRIIFAHIGFSTGPEPDYKVERATTASYYGGEILFLTVQLKRQCN